MRFTTSQAASIVAGQNQKYPSAVRLDDDTHVAILDTLAEMGRAAAKHGDHTDPENSALDVADWFLIVAEEHGEAAKETVEIGALERRGRWLAPEYTDRLQKLYDELTQEAAMALKMMAWLRWKGLVKA